LVCLLPSSAVVALTELGFWLAGALLEGKEPVKHAQDTQMKVSLLFSVRSLSLPVLFAVVLCPRQCDCSCSRER
jgi:hypothetical protein